MRADSSKPRIDAGSCTSWTHRGPRCLLLGLREPPAPWLLKSLLDSSKIANASQRGNGCLRCPVSNAHFIAVAILPGKANGPPPLLWWQFAVAAVVSAVTCLVLTTLLCRSHPEIAALLRNHLARENLGSRPDPSLLYRKMNWEI